MSRIHVLAPLDGTVVALENVPDEVFALKMAGDGVAIDPLAPCGCSSDRVLAKLFKGGHLWARGGRPGFEGCG